MKKRYYILILIVCICIVCLYRLTRQHPSDRSNDANHKADILEKYGNDLDSNLSVFPKEELAENQGVFYSSFHTGLFDTDAEIILVCNLTKEQFDDEIKRLSNLSMTIRNKEEQYTNYVLYDTSSYHYPAYITIDGFGNTYEYALTDPNRNKIIYVYLSYPDIYKKENQQYLKKDPADYNIDEFSSFSMYVHSFDEGKTWTEYDDEY